MGLRLTAPILVLALAIPMFAFAPGAGAQTAGCTPPDTKLATARAATTPLLVTLNGMEITGNVKIDQAKVSSEQTGPGTDTDGGTLFVYETAPGPKPMVRAEILKSETSGTVAASPLKATARGVTEVVALEVNVGGTNIVADVIRADAKGIATPGNAFTDTLPSTHEGLRVNGQWYSYVEPEQEIPLPTALGAGSRILLHHRDDNSQFPSPTNPFYKAEVEVTMIDILVKDAMPVLPGDQTLQVVVAKSWVQARAPVGCVTLQQSVRGAAYTARIWPDGWYHDHFTFGYQSIPKTGGAAEQSLFDQQFKTDESGPDTLLKVESLKTTVIGKVVPGERSISDARSVAQDICVDYNGIRCFVKGTAIETRAHAEANVHAAWYWGDTTFVNVTIGDINVCEQVGMNEERNFNPTTGDITCRPKPNSRFDIPGTDLHVTINEQWDDPNNRAGYQGINVRAIRIEQGDGGADAEGEEPGNILIVRSWAAAEYRLT